MRRKTLGAFSVAAVLIGVGWFAPADGNAASTTLFSNITGFPNISSGLTVETIQSNFYVAKKFTATGSGTSDLISFWAQCLSGGSCNVNGGSTPGTIQIFTDSGGKPGTALGTATSFNAPAFNGDAPICQATASPPTLSTGTAYWAVMKTTGINAVAWEFQDATADTVDKSTDGGATWSTLVPVGGGSERNLSLRVDSGTRQCHGHLLPNPSAGTLVGGMFPRSGHHSFNTITISNDGVGVLHLKSYSITETDASGQTPFTLLDGQPDAMPPGNTFPQTSTVLPGETVILYTTCTGPAQEGHYTATLAMTSDDPSTPSISWPLSCYVDNTPPALSFSLSPDGSHGWFKTSPALVGVIADDGVNGSGTNNIRCSNNGTQVVNSPSGGVSFNVSTEGNNNLSCTASDVAGNVTPTPLTHTVQLDSRKPVPMPSVVPAPNAAGWNNTNVAVSFSCADPSPGSGIDAGLSNLGGGGNFTAETPSSGQLVSSTGSCTDIAGNQSGSGSVTLKIDKTPPTTAVTGAPPARTNSTSASFTLSGSDALSGVAHFQCSLDGAPLSTCTSPATYSALSAGHAHTFTAKAIDAAGNVDPTGWTSTWFVDTTAPTVTFDSPAQNATVQASGDLTFHATDTDDASGLTFTCSFDGATASSCSSPYHYSGLAAGTTHTLKVTATDEATNAGSSTRTFHVYSSPTVATSFGAGSIPLHGSTSMSLSLTNPNATTGLTGVAVSDTLPAGLFVSSPNGLSNTCGGTVTAAAGSGTVAVTGVSLAGAANCAISLNVTGNAAGTKSNATGQVSSTESGTGGTSNTATLDVVAPPTVNKAFSPAAIPINGSSAMAITITNPAANGVGLNGLAFTDSLPTGLIVASPNGLTSSCMGTAAATAGSSTVSLSGGAIAIPGHTCVVQVNVIGTSYGPKSSAVAASSTNGGTGDGGTTGSVTLAVVAPPTISNAFAKPSVALGSSVALTFTITSPSLNAAPLHGIAFIDSLPSGLVVATPNGAGGTCGGSTAATPGGTTIVLTGGTIATPAGSCTVIVNVTGTSLGVKANTTGPVTSTESGPGIGSNTATITVAVAPSVTLTAPLDGAHYNLGQVVNASYSCAESASGPGLQSCVDNQHVGNGKAIDTSTAGSHTFTATATSLDGLSVSKSATYVVVGPPSITITTPADGARLAFGQVANTNYSCQDGTGGPGIKTCSGTIANHSAIGTKKAGSYTLTVTATSNDGQTASRTIHYTVEPDNRFRISHFKTHPGDGSVTFDLTLPGPGTVVVLETAPKSSGASAAAAHGQLVFGRLRVVVHRTKKIHVRVLPNGRGRRLLKKHRRGFVIKLAVTYTPTGGSPRSVGHTGFRVP